jgi:hypothetical protein
MKMWGCLKKSYGSSKKISKYELYYMRYLAIFKGYNDVNWISNTKNLNFINRFIFTIRGAIASWKSSKNTCIFRSIKESKFIALDKDGKEVQ